MTGNMRNIPKVDELISDEKIQSFRPFMTQTKILEIMRQSIDITRVELKNGQLENYSREHLQSYIVQKAVGILNDYILEKTTKVINATGIIIHTNLGRATLSSDAISQVTTVAKNYSNLEYSTNEGKRSNRLRFLEKKIADITGAEAALVVNNNAAAVLLSLNTWAKDGEVILSRGEIVEIGDSFRISEIIETSGCSIKEVGTTNKTHLKDYEKAIGEKTALLLKVHTSNFKVVGFTAEATCEELTCLGQERNLPVLEDMGSGILLDLSKYGFKKERQVQDAVKDGVDIITFSGDKMLGGPQAGIIVGKEKYISPMRKNQLLRCLRADKMCLAALDATLSHYLVENGLMSLPVMKMAITPLKDIEKKGKELVKLLKKNASTFSFELNKHHAQFGGGSMPFETIDSYAIYINSEFFSSNIIEKWLRSRDIPIITTVQNSKVIMDLRTLDTEDYLYIKDVFVALSKTK